MNFIRIYKAESTNPNTGEVVTGLRVDTDTRKSFKLLNTIEELKAYGSMPEVLKALVLKDKGYGDYAQLPGAKFLEEVSW